MMSDDYEARRKRYQRACSRVWNAAKEQGIPMHVALGFFTATDWQQIAYEEISAETLRLIMLDIAQRPRLREQIEEEQQR